MCAECLFGIHEGIKNNQYVKLELTESMLLICSRCSRAFEVKSNGKRELYYSVGFKF